MNRQAAPGPDNPGDRDHRADATNVQSERTGLVALLGTLDGERTLFLGPELREADPPAVREGIARRRLVALGRPCPCGARMVLPNRAARRRARRTGEVLHVLVEHERHCPAPTERIAAAMRRAGGRR
jgi:hypothetical protein